MPPASACCSSIRRYGTTAYSIVSAAQVNRKGSIRSTASATRFRSSLPSEAATANEVIDRLAPISTGPSVSTAQ